MQAQEDSRRDPFRATERADSLWRSLEVLRSHDAHASPEFSASEPLVLDDDTVEALHTFKSIVPTTHFYFSVCADSYALSMKALEGRRLHDLIEAFTRSKRHTPLRWVCLCVLINATWIKPIRAELMCHPLPLFKEMIATIQFYADVGPEAGSTNPYILAASAGVAEALRLLICATGANKTAWVGVATQLADMGVLPALASRLDTLVSARNRQAIVTPGNDGAAAPGEEEEQKLCEQEEQKL